jgi:signal transduction histidine kinase
MVLDILFYAKERELKLERIDVLSLVEEVVKATEPQVKERNIEFKRDFDSDIGDFEVDAGYIQAAVINIIENAMEACAADRSKKDHRIVLGARQAHENIVIEVADNGIGMDLETKEKIFTPFFSSKGKKGTGLGLFISNTIIEQHGGKIIVKSAPGKGTIFNIIIPKMSPESVNATVNEAAAK